MEFETNVHGDKYFFSALDKQTFLVTGPGGEYILYNYGKNWKCADELGKELLAAFGNAIEEKSHQLH
jgi:hypothetical protein